MKRFLFLARFKRIHYTQTVNTGMINDLRFTIYLQTSCSFSLPENILCFLMFVITLFEKNILFLISANLGVKSTEALRHLSVVVYN